MLYTIALVLLVLWVLGLVSSYTLGGFIHLLLVIAVVMLLVQLISLLGAKYQVTLSMRRFAEHAARADRRCSVSTIQPINLSQRSQF